VSGPPGDRLPEPRMALGELAPRQKLRITTEADAAARTVEKTFISSAGLTLHAFDTVRGGMA